MTAVGTKLQLRSTQYERIEKVVIQAFVHHRPYTQHALAGAMAAEFGVSADAAASGMVYYLRQLASRGIYEAQAGRFGSKGAQAKGSPTSPRWFNWSGVPVQAATLRHVLEPYLESPDVEEWRRAAVRKALRFGRGLPDQCADSIILEEAGRIPAADLYDLPDAVFEEAEERHRLQTAKNYRSALRHLLEFGASRRLIPIVFPYFLTPDAWAEFTDQHFPLAAEGDSSPYVKRHRNGMSYIRRAAIALYGDDVTPSEIDRVRADAIVKHLEDNQGKRDAAKRAAGTLRELANSLRVERLAIPSPIDRFTVHTKHGPRPAIYLRGPDTIDTRGWDGFLDQLTAHGFPGETVEYLRWYGTYVTMSPRELMKRENRLAYPGRRDAHKLSPNSLVRRVVALRAYLGAAVNVLGMKPAELTPSVLFGTGFDDIAHALLDWWHDRREALRSQGGDSAISGGLGHYIIGVGMVCYTRYELLRHQRRLTVAAVDRSSLANPHDRTVRIDTMAEEGVAKTPQEAAAWDAYRQSAAIHNRLQALVKEERGSNRAGMPEFKNLREMMHRTPPQWFITILDQCVDRVRAGMRTNDESMRHHKLVRDTVDLALHVSTGCRSEEICLLRVDTHLAQECLATRVVRLHARERKNNKDHDVLLQPAYLPDDILSHYLEKTRPFFMRDQYTRARRVGGHGPKVARPEQVRQHPFLMVSTRGNEYGVLDLNENAEVLRLARRAQDHGRNLTTFLAREAVAAKLTLPGRKYELGPHTIRGVFAYALYVMTGSSQAAAHYLGDEEQTLLHAYSAINGVHVDSSALIGFSVAPRLGTRANDASAVPASSGGVMTATPQGDRDREAEYLAKLEALRADRRTGIINQNLFEATAAAYARQYGHVDQAGGKPSLAA